MFFITCNTSTTQLKTIIAHYIALGMAECAMIEFLFDDKLICVLSVNMVIAFFGFETNEWWLDGLF